MHNTLEGRDYGQLKDLISDKTPSDKTCRKAAGNSKKERASLKYSVKLLHEWG